jgi:hypothetical protein
MSDPPTARSRVSLPARRAILHCSGERGKKGVEPARPGALQATLMSPARRASARSDQARAAHGRAEQEIERLQRAEEAVVVAASAPRERGCPPWVVLGVEAVGARGVRAVPPGPFHHQ